MEQFIKERTEYFQVFPFPEDKETVYQNPPCFIWIGIGKPCEYTAVVYKDKREIFRGTTTNNYILPDLIFESGEYEWDLIAEGVNRGVYRFTVAEDAIVFKPPTAKEIFDQIPDVHPRTLFFKEDIEQLKQKKTELSVLKRNVAQAYKDGLIAYPEFHRDKNALAYREYFGKYREYCDRDLVATALAYAILGDEKAGEHAKNLLIHLCSMTPNGPASLIGKYGDEVGLSNARVFPAVYDLIYDLLSNGERDLIEWTIYIYGLQCEKRLKRLNYCLNPGSSHAGRLPAYLADCAMALRYSNVCDEETVLRWISYATEIYSGIFPYYGGSDGGWAEGSFYASSYTRWYVPFFNEVERFTGKTFLAKPFYHNLITFMMHFLNPEYEVHPFGDGYWCKSSDKEWPGFFAQNPFRFYAERFGDERACELSKKCANQELYELHLLDIFMGQSAYSKEQAKKPGMLRNFECFKESGFVSMHSNILNSKEDFACQIRASKFGSDSHRHADQGSFALFYAGKSLISPSGFFGRKYGTAHHKHWTKTSKAHNTLLFNGKGQYETSHLAKGMIKEFLPDKDSCTVVIDCGDAYPVNVSWTRKFVFEANKLIVTDEIKSEEEVDVTYPLHSFYPFQQDGQHVICKNGVTLEIEMLTEYEDLQFTDQYDTELNEGEPPEYHVTMPKQYHLYYQFKKAHTHKIVCVFQIRSI